MHESIKQIADKLKDKYLAERVILFGSYANGNPTIDSDIDLLIIKSTKKRFFERYSEVKKVIRGINKGIPITPLVITPEELQERIWKGDQFISDILQNGINI